MSTPEESVMPDTSNPVAILTTLLGTRMSERARKLLTAYVVGIAAYGYGKKAWTKYHKVTTFTVSVSDSDGIYPEIQQWLLDLIPDHKRASLSARSARHISGRRSNSPECAEEDSSPKKKIIEQQQHLFLSYDGSRNQTVNIDGHEVVVSVNSPERPADSSDESFRSWMNGNRQIQFCAKNQEGRDAVISFLGRISAKHHSVERVPNFYLSTTWGEWSRRNDLPRRNPATVVLPDGQMERLINDLDTFLASEEKYDSLGVPYHRGYLLHGPAGTGKTSVARAIATHFAMDIYYLTLSDLDKDTKLLQMVSAVTSGSMLLLEDIDVLHATRDREQDSESGDEAGRVSLSGLLNALDGVASPHGIIVFMTTNHVDRLDPALIRPGRVDLSEHIGYVTMTQLEGLFNMTFGYVPDLPWVDEETKLTASTVVGVLKQNLDDADKAFKELNVLVEDRS